jgi:hypothetical protein
MDQTVPVKNAIEVDCYEGSDTVLLILTGLGGTVKGFQNKYVSMAESIRAKHNTTIFVAATPEDSWERNKAHAYLSLVMQFIDEKCSKRGLTRYNIYAVGHSAGGTFLLWYAHEFDIKRVVATNPVLTVNFHKLESGLINFKGDFAKVILGDKDPMFRYAGLLEGSAEIRILQGGDHNFTGKQDELISMITNCLFIPGQQDESKHRPE